MILCRLQQTQIQISAQLKQYSIFFILTGQKCKNLGFAENVIKSNRPQLLKKMNNTIIQ